VNTGVHRAAAEGYGAAADAYRRSRPGYPDRLVTWLADELRIGPDTDVLDLAAGTGAFTRGLVPTGARVMAVEPVARMRQILAAELPGVAGTRRDRGAGTTPRRSDGRRDRGAGLPLVRRRGRSS
jgi:SAM-dependent methyltransferase